MERQVMEGSVLWKSLWTQPFFTLQRAAGVGKVGSQWSRDGLEDEGGLRWIRRKDKGRTRVENSLLSLCSFARQGQGQGRQGHRQAYWRSGDPGFRLSSWGCRLQNVACWSASVAGPYREGGETGCWLGPLTASGVFSYVAADRSQGAPVLDKWRQTIDAQRRRR